MNCSMSHHALWLVLVMSLSMSLNGCAEETSSASLGGPAKAMGSTGRSASRLAPDDEARGFRPFVMTSHDSRSTFAADVDTASYDIFRQHAEADLEMQARQVRLEEFVNAFDYSYDAPVDGAEHPFAVTMTLAENELFPETPMLRVGVQARMPGRFEKKPANLVFLVDVSGSMQSSDKLELVKTTLELALDQLEPSDTVSIVTYAGQVGVPLRPTPISDRAQIIRALRALESGGSTAGAAGIDLAYEQAESAFIEGGINHVVLCTDGDFNVGPSSTEELVELIVKKRETGITLTVAGFGFGLADDMMEAISNKGNGVYAVIYSEERAAEYVKQELMSSIVHVGKDVKIQVEFNRDHVLAYRQLGYDNRQLEDDEFRNDVIDAGEVGEGHQVTALYQLAMEETALPAPDAAPEARDGDDETDPPAFDDPTVVARVRVRYKAPGATATDEAVEFTTSIVAPTSVAEGSVDDRWALAVAALAEKLADNPFANAAQTAIEQTLRANARDQADRLELVQLLE